MALQTWDNRRRHSLGVGLVFRVAPAPVRHRGTGLSLSPPTSVWGRRAGRPTVTSLSLGSRGGTVPPPPREETLVLRTPRPHPRVVGEGVAVPHTDAFGTQTKEQTLYPDYRHEGDESLLSPCLPLSAGCSGSRGLGGPRRPPSSLWGVGSPSHTELEREDHRSRPSLMERQQNSVSKTP